MYNEHNSSISKVLVDADACPVKSEIKQITLQYNVPVLFVASYEHFSLKNEDGFKWVYVDTSKESADLYIMNHVQEQDIVVTQDTGLASILVSKKVWSISPHGKVFNDMDMDSILHARYISAKERRKGNYGKGPKAFTNEDRQHFAHQFSKILSKNEGIGEKI